MQLYRDFLAHIGVPASWLCLFGFHGHSTTLVASSAKTLHIVNRDVKTDEVKDEWPVHLHFYECQECLRRTVVARVHPGARYNIATDPNMITIAEKWTAGVLPRNVERLQAGEAAPQEAAP